MCLGFKLSHQKIRDFMNCFKRLLSSLKGIIKVGRDNFRGPKMIQKVKMSNNFK